MKGSEVVLQGRQLKQVVQKYKLIQPVRVLERDIFDFFLNKICSSKENLSALTVFKKYILSVFPLM